MHERAIIYVRTMSSTPDQVERAIDDLRRVATERGWTIAAVVIDDAGLDARRYPGIEGVKKRIKQGDISSVMVPSLTCIGSSVDELISIMEWIRSAGTSIYAHEQGIDTATADGGNFLTAMRFLDGYREALRLERIKIGRQRAKAAGVRFGRSPVPDAKIQAVRQSLQSGVGIRPTARAIGLSPAKVHAISLAMKGRQEAAEAIDA